MRYKEFKNHKHDYQNAVDGKILGVTATNDIENNEVVLNISGVVGSEWDGMDARTIVPLIQAVAKGTTIRQRLNTPGGLVFDALDIYDALVEHDGPVIADIVAEAWSSGTILCAAADTVRIRPMAKYGIHRVWSGALLMGNAEQIEDQIPSIRELANTLKAIDRDLIGMLADRSKNSKDEVEKLIVGENGDGTEFVGQDAVDAGFVDELMEREKKESNKRDKEWAAAARKRAIDLLQMKA